MMPLYDGFGDVDTYVHTFDVCIHDDEHSKYRGIKPLHIWIDHDLSRTNAHLLCDHTIHNGVECVVHDHAYQYDINTHRACKLYCFDWHDTDEYKDYAQFVVIL